MRRWHPDAWFDRQLAHARACLAEAEREHSPREIEAAWAALTDPREAQQPLFHTTPNAGLIPSGQPEPSGLAGVLFLGG